MHAFFRAAIPWVLAGIALAFACGWMSRKE